MQIPIRFLGTIVAGGNELLNVHAVNQAWVFCKSTKCSSLLRCSFSHISFNALLGALIYDKNTSSLFVMHCLKYSSLNGERVAFIFIF